MARRFIALAALALGLAAPAAAHAQSQSPFRLGLALGPTFPMGDLGDSQDWGYHIGGFIAGRPSMSPLGLRGEVMYHSLTGNTVNTPLGSFEYDDASLIAGIVNVEVGMSGMGLTPYFVGGVGYYSFDSGGENSDREGDFGLNGGLGINFGLAGFSAFAEARYHKIFVGEDASGNSPNISLIPISFGVRF